MADDIFSKNYLRYNTQQTKNICVVVKIPGLDLLSNIAVYTRIRYGTPHIFYGDPGIVYGGLVKKEGVRDILSLDGSSLTISQKLEPEQGRASVSLMTLAFIDKDQYMTQATSPGKIIDEILGKPINVYLGYQDISYPEDFTIIMRGRVSGVTSAPGLVTLQISDPNFQRREDIFRPGSSQITTNLNPTDTDIAVLDNSSFYQVIRGPDGLFDVPYPWNATSGNFDVNVTKKTGVRTFLKIDDEYIEYGPNGYSPNAFHGCIRGARGTTAKSHTVATNINGAIEVTDNAMLMALKLMLSGWGGNWISGVPILNLVTTFDPILGDQPNAIVLPQDVDAKKDYGLFEGDTVVISGSSISTNNNTFKIVRFADLFDQPNRLIYVTGPVNLVHEPMSPALLAFRSQFDTYPVLAGNGLTPEDVDIEKHITLFDGFIDDPGDTLQFFVTDVQTLKTFLESQVYLPVAAYSLTKRGKLSVGFTIPPLATTTLLFLNQDNLLDPQNIQTARAVNNRKFFNEIDWSFDFSDDGNATATAIYLDSESLSKVGVSVTLPIEAKGVRRTFHGDQLLEKRSKYLLSRYKRGATILSNIKTNWEVGSRIEAGDVVAVQDDGHLQITNFDTGDRDLGTKLFEVQNRMMDAKNGNTTLELVSGIGSDVTDRFATISPSSVIVSGTNSYLIIQDSFGAIFPGDEMRKWRDYINQPIVIHSADYTTYYQQTIITGFDVINNYKMFVSGFAVMPAGNDFSNLIIDIPYYPDTTRKLDNSLYKAIHAFWSPKIAVTSGASDVQFDVADGSKFFVGSRVIVHNSDYSLTSDLDNECTVTSVTGNTIVVNKSLTFTPDNTCVVEGIGFPDKQGFYRLI